MQQNQLRLKHESLMIRHCYFQFKCINDDTNSTYENVKQFSILLLNL